MYFSIIFTKKHNVKRVFVFVFYILIVVWLWSLQLHCHSLYLCIIIWSTWSVFFYQVLLMNSITASLLSSRDARLQWAQLPRTARHYFCSSQAFIFTSDGDLYICFRRPMAAPVDPSSLIWLGAILKGRPDGNHQSRSVGCRLRSTSCSQTAVLLHHRAGKTRRSTLADISAVELQDRCPDAFM